MNLWNREQELRLTGIGGIGNGGSVSHEFVESGAGAPSHRNLWNRERELPPTGNSGDKPMNRFPSRGSHQLRKGRHSMVGEYYFLTTSTFGRRRMLSNSEIAEVIFGAFEWFEAQGRIKWMCVVVMPDHIHAVIQLGQGQTLPKVMQSLKSFTARQINKLLGERGTVWQDGYYDHGIRKDESLDEIIRYCYENPVRWGLVEQARDYPYWWCKFKME